MHPRAHMPRNRDFELETHEVLSQHAFSPLVVNSGPISVPFRTLFQGNTVFQVQHPRQHQGEA